MPRVNRNIEVWRKVVGYEKYYAVSSFGRVKSRKKRNRYQAGQILKSYQTSEGYIRINLMVEGTHTTAIVHQLVAQAFIPNPENKPYVNHIDFQRNNNNSHNLEWCTAKENNDYTISNNRNNPSKGEDHRWHKLTTDQVINIHHCKGSIDGVKLAKLYGVHSTTIYGIFHERLWKHLWRIAL